MPGSTKAMHPSGKLEITFTEEDHVYMDGNAITYTSATTLVKSAFPPFDAAAAAAAKEAKTGRPAAEWIAEWNEIGRKASDDGTRCHENCERQILGQYDRMNKPRDDAERKRFRIAWHEVEKIKAARFLKLEPEKLVFSPRFMVAGSIDLLAQKAPDDFAIIDWKYIRELKRESFGGRTGNHLATAALPDCNFWHYALQLNIYEQILRIEGYIPPAARVTKMLNVYDDAADGFDHVILPDLGREAVLLLAWNVTSDNLEPCPF